MRKKESTINDSYKKFGFLGILIVATTVIFYNNRLLASNENVVELQASVEEMFMATWNRNKNTDAFLEVKKILVEELGDEFDPCPTTTSKISDSEPELTIEELARKYLVTDFESFTQQGDYEKYDYIKPSTTATKCESNPELNKYIHKPQFSRDQYDYTVFRDGYTPRRLVCDELSSHEKGHQSKYWLQTCNNTDLLADVITVVGTNLTQYAIEQINNHNLNIVSLSASLTTPYALVLNNHFDFDKNDANLERMVREAENQNADLVLGAWRNEVGQWSSSCLHYNVQNYTLSIWDGYYKSISSMKYCDMGIGPVLVRSEHFDEKLSSLKLADRLDYHLRRPNLRVLSCLDCMFYQSDNIELTKESLQPLAFIYTLNQINYDESRFDFTCPEAGIICDRFYYEKAGLSQPPCCMKVLTGMMMALIAEYEKINITDSVCIYCGQVLAALKMPGKGGQLPWDVDLDLPIMTVDFDVNAEYVMVDSVLEKYGLTEDKHIREHKPQELGKLAGSYVKLGHKFSDYTIDNFAKAPYSLQCGHQFTDHNRSGTKMLLDGIRVPAPDNPGAYGRTYGNEIYRHILWVESSQNIYNDKDAEFKSCNKPPQHACLANYPADGNIQFRDDLHALQPLN